jgi:hypothetical protein
MVEVLNRNIGESMMLITVQKRRKNAVLWKKSTVDSNFNVHFSKENGKMEKFFLNIKTLLNRYIVVHF